MKINPTDQAFPIPPTSKPNGEREVGIKGMDIHTYLAAQFMPSADQIPAGKEVLYAKMAMEQATVFISVLNDEKD